MTARRIVLTMMLAAAMAGHAAAAPLSLQGYAEGDFLRIASPTGGILAELAVAEGASVAAGTPLFSIDTTLERAACARAAADLDRARAILADLTKGRRPDEIRQIIERRAQAVAALALSTATLRRQEVLVRGDYASRARLDEARSALDRDRALVRQSDAELRVARLGARPDEIAAQLSAVTEAEAVLAQAEKRLADLTPMAPADGRIDRIYYRPGETVPPGQPVLSMLPPANVKLVLFVPEPLLATVGPGRVLRYRADGGTEGTATVTHVSPRAEYTPPVIYSIESRAKLVYRVEARGLAAPLDLKPGQPVDVLLDPP